ncbi:phage tail protein [Thermomonas sp.]|uniref:phage tail-collar fiber domain-containing protein n=1 Tax=Thermomonas sp. TaxID=1971895 RepID=UPI0035AF239B
MTMTTYCMLPTQTGQAKLAAFLAGGDPLALVAMAVGDGGGVPVVPTDTVAALVREVHRQPLSSLTTHPVNTNWVTAETVLAPAIGGWTIRELGVFDADGDLIAYGNFPESYKPILSEGSGKELVIRAILEVSDTAAITLTVDSSVLWATQAWVDAKGYATQTWVTSQAFATQAWVSLQGYATQAWVNTQGFAVTAGNLGAGGGQLFSTKAGSTLQFRSIKAGSNVTVSQTGTEITIAAANGVDNTASNLGAGAGQVYAAKSGADLQFRSLKAGSNVTVSQTGTEITIAATNGVDNTASNLGAGAGQVYADKVGADLRFRSIKAGSNVTVSQAGNEITIAAQTPPAYTSAAHVRIPGQAGNDWMIQTGTATAPASGTYSTSKAVTYPFPFKPGASPNVCITPVAASTSGGPPVPVLAAPPSATGFMVLFDIAEGGGDSANIGTPIAFQWVAQGVVDGSGWLSGAAITYTAAAGTPATATVSVTAGTYTNGVTSKAYDASTAALSGTGGSSITYYLYYEDPAFSGGAKTLKTTTDSGVPFATAGNIVVGQVTVAYPSSGTGSGGGDPGGGGGGGSCPSVDAFVIGRSGLLRAGDVRVGDELLLCDPANGEECFGVVTYSAPAIADGCRLAFGAGSLTCSTTAPIPTELGYLPAPQTPGHIVPTRTIHGTRADSTVADAISLGAITVQHITVGDRCFWAGDDGVAFVLHHNIKMAPY